MFGCFNEKFPDLCKDPKFVKPGKIPGKWHLNLKEFVFYSLVKSGVKPENIDNSFPCTSCSPDEFFSHRYHKEKRGTMCAMIALKK